MTLTLRGRVQCRLIDADPVSPCALGPIQSGVSPSNERLPHQREVRAVGKVELSRVSGGHADAHSGRDVTALPRHRDLAQFPIQDFGHVSRTGHRCVWQQHHELFSPIADLDVTVPELLVQALPNRCQEGVTTEVPVGVVDGLEVVQVPA